MFKIVDDWAVFKNEPIDDVPDIPSGITKIRFGMWFNYPIDKLKPIASNITHFTSSLDFNQPISHVISYFTNLTCLKLQDEFTYPIDNLPTSLTHLKFYNHFNKPLNIYLPNLTFLKLSYEFNQNIDFNLLPNLTHLVLCSTHKLPPCAYYMFRITSISGTIETKHPTLHKRLKTNRHNLHIKQTPFYDLICE